MSWSQLRAVILADLYRYTGRIDSRAFTKQVLLNEGFKYSVAMRVSSATLSSRRVPAAVKRLPWLVVRRYSHKYGIQIPPEASIGPGLHIGHFGGIVVSHGAVVGRDCNISQDVTVGVKGSGARAGYPEIGDRVYIGPGARIIGGVSVGNDVAIGANCVVTADVPDGAVVVGVPGRVISQDGSNSYINKIDYAGVLPELADLGANSQSSRTSNSGADKSV